MNKLPIILMMFFAGCDALPAKKFNGSGGVKAENNGAVSPSPDVEIKSAKECFAPAKPLPNGLSEPVLKWEWAETTVLMSPVVGPLVNKKPSVVTIGNISQQLVVLDGATGATQWFSNPSQYSVVDIMPALGDIDNDGQNEIVVYSGSANALLAIDGKTGRREWSTLPMLKMDRWTSGIEVADLDKDGTVEVIAGRRVYNGADGTEKFTFGESFDSTYTTSAVDVVGDSNLEIIYASGVYSGTTGNEICKFPTPIMYLGVGKMRKNDKYHTVIGMHHPVYFELDSEPGSRIVAYRADNCSELYKKVPNGIGGGAVNISDVDGDGELEFSLASKNSLTMYETDGSEKWQKVTQDGSSGVTGATTFDFNGDGKAEVVYNDEVYLRVYDGETGRVIYEIENSTGTTIEYPVVADIDGDGHSDIVVSAMPFAGGDNTGVRAFQAPDNDWVGSRPIWNQYGYNVTSVSDTGKLVDLKPSNIIKKFLEYSYLLGFRNNLSLRPLLDEPGCK